MKIEKAPTKERFIETNFGTFLIFLDSYTRRTHNYAGLYIIYHTHLPVCTVQIVAIFGDNNNPSECALELLRNIYSSRYNVTRYQVPGTGILKQNKS